MGGVTTGLLSRTELPSVGQKCVSQLFKLKLTAQSFVAPDP